MKKIVNGILVELAPGIGCRGCLFMDNYGGVKNCETTDVECLNVRDGGWVGVDTPEIDDNVESDFNEDPIY